MPDPLKYVQGDTAPDLRVTLTDQDTGNAIDVSSATVRLYLRLQGGVSVTSITGTKPGGGTDGVVLFSWPSGSFAAAGSYESEIEITYSTGKVETVFDKIKYEAREQIA